MPSKLQNEKNLVVSLCGLYIDKYINNYNRLKPENIMKLKHYMQNGLNVYQKKHCKTTFLSPAAPILHNIQSSSSRQNNIITSDIATNPLL